MRLARHLGRAEGELRHHRAILVAVDVGIAEQPPGHRDRVGAPGHGKQRGQRAVAGRDGDEPVDIHADDPARLADRGLVLCCLQRGMLGLQPGGAVGVRPVLHQSLAVKTRQQPVGAVCAIVGVDQNVVDADGAVMGQPLRLTGPSFFMVVTMATRPGLGSGPWWAAARVGAERGTAGAWPNSRATGSASASAAARLVLGTIRPTGWPRWRMPMQRKRLPRPWPRLPGARAGADCRASGPARRTSGAARAAGRTGGTRDRQSPAGPGRGISTQRHGAPAAPARPRPGRSRRQWCRTGRGTAGRKGRARRPRVPRPARHGAAIRTDAPRPAAPASGRGRAGSCGSCPGPRGH